MTKGTKLNVPSALVAVLDEYEAKGGAFDCVMLSGVLGQARQSLQDPSADDNHAAWAECLAFALTGHEHGEKPWDTHFGPMGSGKDAAGNTVYFPDAREADQRIYEHWAARAHEARSPVMVARYADLVWDMAHFLGKTKRDVTYANLAAEAYLTLAALPEREEYHAFPEAERALSLGILIKNDDLRDRARAALLALQDAANGKGGRWWQAFDILEAQPKAGTTNDEWTSLAASLERILADSSNAADTKTLDPHSTEDVAKRLTRYYRRLDRHEEIMRLNLIVAQTFEQFGAMAGSMLAATVYQTSMEAYERAGKPADAQRILGLMEQANLDSVAHMQKFEREVEIPKEEVEKFIASIVVHSKEETFMRIAAEFLGSQNEAEESLRETAKSSPLIAMIGKSKLSGNRVVAQIGSIEDDPTGNLIERMNQHLGMSTNWLGWTMREAREKHSWTADDLTAFINRTGLFGDAKLLREGIAAWLDKDHVKAIHVLIPQVETGLRTLVRRCGRPTTKPDRNMKQARMVITMGDIVTSDETAAALGKRGNDFMLHFRALFADPRGHNLRNDVAHGLMPADAADAGNMLWVVHALLLLGAWLTPVEG
ncbi:MAG TPA: DUF4209 domain-containing protein [Hyphomonadaceae bacterium]|nr:DUF4209 domain-containing protein [Hyphomonadaceae bacterium]